MRALYPALRLAPRHLSALALAAGMLSATTAAAHVSISSGPAAANKSQKITFSVGHGCSDEDTMRVRVEIPASITSVRALLSDFGRPTLTKSGTTVTAVEWVKPVGETRLDEDIGYYELTIRARVADVPFTQIAFTVHQSCIVNDVETTVSWDQPLGATTGNPAPQLTVVPARTGGWNKFVLGATTTVPAASFGTYFGDAQIVWRGTAAFSANVHTAALITGTADVTALGDLQPGDELWVRY